MNSGKKTLITVTLLFSGVSAQAGLSANAGFASEYYFRGVLQNDSSASAGIDYQQSGFYAGAWTADVGDGLEYDLYGGYDVAMDNGFSFGAGVIGYYYTGDTFDDSYEEINLKAGFSIVSFEFNTGTHKLLSGGTQHYTFSALSLDKGGFHCTYGSFAKDIKGDYFELGYDYKFSGFDFGIALIFSDKNLSQEVDDKGKLVKDEAITLSVSKTFDL